MRMDTVYTTWQATYGNGVLMNTMQISILFLRRRNPLAGGTVNGILSNWIDVSSVRVLRGGSWVSNAKFVRGFRSHKVHSTDHEQRSWISLREVCNHLKSFVKFD